jgi:hypothetical protein
MSGGTPDKRKNKLADDSGAADGELTDSAVDMLERRRGQR